MGIEPGLPKPVAVELMVGGALAVVSIIFVLSLVDGPRRRITPTDFVLIELERRHRLGTVGSAGQRHGLPRTAGVGRLPVLNGLPPSSDAFLAVVHR